MNKIIQGDCIEELKKLEDNSVDAIVTDPPYGLEFMGKEWDAFKKTGKSNLMHGTEEEGIQGCYGVEKNFKVLPRFPKGFNLGLQKFCFDWAKECLRVLKPGGFLLSFGGTRTYHRLVCGIEDAGFEIRDTIMWLYGSGFPKSANISLLFDKRECMKQLKEKLGRKPTKEEFKKEWENFRKIIGKGYGKSLIHQNKVNLEQGFRPDDYYKENEGNFDITEPKTPEAKEWEGWGTALKPACEPIVVARKPLSEKNVALNILKWGTGGINISGCRIGFLNKEDEFESKNKNQHSKYPNSIMRNPAPHGIYPPDKRPPEDYTAQGRFPANILLECTCDEVEEGIEKISGGFGAMEIGMSDTGKGITQNYDKTKSKSKENTFKIHTNPNCPCYILDEQSGDTSQGHWSKTKTTGFGKFGNGKSEYYGVGEKDKTKHGASRFFYCAKSSKAERNLGCEDFEAKAKCEIDKMGGEKCSMKTGSGNERNVAYKNNHPTVKPIKLMEYLIKLVSKEGATILDPFLGSGTTAIACIKLNRQFIGIEKEEEYIKISEARIKPYLEQRKL